jgi:hypothetical protein
MLRAIEDWKNGRLEGWKAGQWAVDDGRWTVRNGFSIGDLRLRSGRTDDGPWSMVRGRFIGKVNYSAPSAEEFDAVLHFFCGQGGNQLQ